MTVKPLTRSDAFFLGAFGLVKLLIHLPILERYGWHHDELYFLACGRHVSFGYVDHSPLIPWIARLSQELFPGSLFGLRIFSVLAGAVAIVLTGLLTRRLGGGRFAQGVACLTMLVGTVFLRMNGVVCIPAFEILFWIGGSYLAIVAIDEDRPRLWLAVGLVAGLGLMTKHSVLFFGFGLAVALVLTPARRHLRSPWLYLGGLVAFVVFLPNLLWQMANGWPTYHFLQAIHESHMNGITAFQFLVGQVLYHGPVSMLVWGAGLAFFFLNENGRRFRVLGWIYVAVLVLLVVIKSKIYYLTPAYPALLAGGGVLIETWAQRRRWLRFAVPAVLLAGNLVLLPVSMPILPIDATESFVRTVTFHAFDNVYELTGDLRGMFGWKERVEAVAEVYNSLPAKERERTVIYSGWYGPAGAVDLFGPKLGLPHAVSGHLTYHMWGLPPGPIDTLIAVEMPLDILKERFEDVTVMKEIEIPEANPWDRDFQVVLCRRPKVDLHKLWPSTLHYD